MRHPWLRYLRLYFKLQLIQLRATVEYRADFWIGVVGAMFLQASGLVFVITIFSQISQIEGWTAWNVAILYGMAMICTGMRELFCDGPWLLRAYINQGTFDRVLVRPISPALQMGTAIASIHGLGGVSLGIVALTLGLRRSEIAWHWWTVPYLLVVLVFGIVMLCAFAYLSNLVGFWEPNTQSGLPTLMAMMVDFAKLPVSLYNTVVQVLIVVILPYAFISYFPALVLLDRDSDWKWLGFVTPLATIWVAGVTSWIWSKGVNRYQGVGH